MSDDWDVDWSSEEADRPDSFRVAADELRSFVERVERLDAEAQDVREQKKEVLAEAKARGYDTKILKAIITLRKRNGDDVAEEEAIMDMYKNALGMN